MGALVSSSRKEAERKKVRRSALLEARAQDTDDVLELFDCEVEGGEDAECAESAIEPFTSRDHTGASGTGPEVGVAHSSGYALVPFVPALARDPAPRLPQRMAGHARGAGRNPVRMVVMRPVPSDLQLEPVSPMDVSPTRSPMQEVAHLGAGTTGSPIHKKSRARARNGHAWSPKRTQAAHLSPQRHCSPSQKMAAYLCDSLDLENCSPSNGACPNFAHGMGVGGRSSS